MHETFLITGANRGLGLEFVKQLAERGKTVFAACRNPNTADALADLAAAFPERVIIVSLDVNDDASIAAAVAQVQQKTDHLDVLLNNAGVMSKDRAGGESGREDMMRVLAVNTVSPLMVARAFRPLLKRGSLVFMMSSLLGSIASHDPDGVGNWRVYGYNSSKAALNMITRMLAGEWKDDGIGTFAMSPGWVQTDMGGAGATYTPAESIRQMLAVIAQPAADLNGRFLGLEGQDLPW